MGSSDATNPSFSHALLLFSFYAQTLLTDPNCAQFGFHYAEDTVQDHDHNCLDKQGHEEVGRKPLFYHHNSPVVVNKLNHLEDGHKPGESNVAGPLEAAQTCQHSAMVGGGALPAHGACWPQCPKCAHQ